jgi:nucleotide-binding universal stress UspA family protein
VRHAALAETRIEEVATVRDIVVHSPGFHAWHGSVRYAAQLAAAMQASLTGLFVAPSATPAPGPPKLVAEMAAYVQDELQQAMLAGRDFAAWANQFGVSDARWQVAIGPAADALAIASDWHDLVVLQGDAAADGPEVRLMGEVLFAGASCITVPQGNVAPGRLIHAMVTWDGSPASSRALHAALPLLRSAQVISLLQPGREWLRRDPADAISHLRAQGVAVAAVETVPGVDEAASEQLLAYANDMRADLIVMGASGRLRRGEQCLGPTTRAVLAQSRLPVFLKN